MMLAFIFGKISESTPGRTPELYNHIVTLDPFDWNPKPQQHGVAETDSQWLLLITYAGVKIYFYRK
jgi:hypothetical protein